MSKKTKLTGPMIVDESMAMVASENDGCQSKVSKEKVYIKPKLTQHHRFNAVAFYLDIVNMLAKEGL